MTREAIVLIGHGAAATDTPRPLVAELKRLESERLARRELEMSAREAVLDRQVRGWPRTPETDPYRAGVEEIARALAPKLGGRRLVVAYNEFCAPSVEDAVEALVAEGFGRLRLISTMFTRGGIHAECEIPGIVLAARRKHPGAVIDYAWPFDAGFVAEFLAAQLARAASAPAAP
jgi:sirohydrochlorin cobaltochelatase